MARSQAQDLEQENRLFTASQWQLMWHKLRKHRLAMMGLLCVVGFYGIALFCEFLAPYGPRQRFHAYTYAPPQRVRVVHAGRLQRPFVYGYDYKLNMQTFRREYTENPDRLYPLRVFVRGEPYKLLGMVPMERHLFGTGSEAPIFLFGSDHLGRDVFSRVLYGTRISLSIGLVGVLLSFVLGLVLGGISGYFGGVIDEIIQRLIDLLISIPTIPLWMALSAALPSNWPILKTFFAITVIFSLIGWTGLARVVRGKFLALREEDFVTSARLVGCSEARIIGRHLVPSFLSYVVVSLTLAIPGMILGETALSFLGLGIQPPAVSWGVLLQAAQDVNALANHPWILIPCAFVIAAVLMLNFLGDGLRDAADPYTSG